LLPLLSDAQDEAVQLATARLDRFPEVFETVHSRVMRDKLGLSSEDAGDTPLVDDLLRRMAQNHVDFSLFFRALCDSAEDATADARVAALFQDPSAFHGFAEAWRRRLRLDRVEPEVRARAMRAVNPAFIPRNHRIEQAIVAATNGNFEPFEALVRVLARPYDAQPEFAYLAEPPQVSERVT